MEVECAVCVSQDGKIYYQVIHNGDRNTAIHVLKTMHENLYNEELSNEELSNGIILEDDTSYNLMWTTTKSYTEVIEALLVSYIKIPLCTSTLSPGLMTRDIKLPPEWMEQIDNTLQYVFMFDVHLSP